MRRDSVIFDYLAKAGVRRVHAIGVPQTYEVVRALKRRRGDGPELLAYREAGRWRDVHSEDINEYLKGDWETTSAPRTSAPGTRRAGGRLTGHHGP